MLHIPNIAHVWEYPPPHSQGRRRNRYRPSCLIRAFLKAASMDTSQTTFTENQLSGFLFSFICHPFFFIVSCMKECGSTKLETLAVKQKNNGTICVSMLIITYTRKPQVNNFHVVISHGGQLVSLVHIHVQ